MKWLLLGVIVTAAACNSEPGDSAGESTAMTTDATTSGGATTDPTSTTDSTSTTTGELGYCYFEKNAPEPFFTLDVLGGMPLVDGVVWPLECGAQGLWMFGLYPSVGGWDPPPPESLGVMVEVDVEGYNTNPAGHFYSAQDSYGLRCSEEGSAGGVLGVLPVFPPDELPDLSVLDGLPAHVRVTELDSGKDLTVEAMVTLSAPKELVQNGGCF
jgi:hypothetical protein